MRPTTKDLPQKKLRGVAHAAAKQYGDVKSLRFLETRGGDARFLVKTTTGDVYVSVSVISPYRVISAEPVEFKPGRGWIPRDNPNFPPYSRQLKVGDRVQFSYEPGTGGVIQSFEGGTALVSTSRGVRKVPTNAIKLSRSELMKDPDYLPAWAKVFG